MISDFYGETSLLSRFLEITEQLVKKIKNKRIQNNYLMSSILAKIKGKAAANIASCVLNNWDNLKRAILNAYADKKNIFTLAIKLTECIHENESAFVFLIGFNTY